MPRWIVLKNVPSFLWHFWPQMMEPIDKIIRMDESNRIISHLNARILISIKPGVDIPVTLNLNIEGENFSWPTEVLGGLNACFLCKKEGHRRKECLIINEKKPGSEANSAKSFSNNVSANPKLAKSSVPNVNVDDNGVKANLSNGFANPKMVESLTPNSPVDMSKINSVANPNIGHPTIEQTKLGSSYHDLSKSTSLTIVADPKLGDPRDEQAILGVSNLEPTFFSPLTILAKNFNKTLIFSATEMIETSQNDSF